MEKYWSIRISHGSASLVGVICCALLLGGCGKVAPPQFRLNLLEMANEEVSEKKQQDISNILVAMFGTPDEPHVLDPMGLDINKLRMAAGPVSINSQGESRGLFRRHCSHCHGISGNGDGPTAVFLNPYPRDYRLGKFKFKSTKPGSKPTRADLLRTLTEGIPGTAMPSFKLLPEAKREALVEYVIYLSMRGQVEIGLAQEANELDEDEPMSDPEFLLDVLLDDILILVTKRWIEAEKNVIQPDPKYIPAADRTPEELAASEKEGQKIFYGKGNCFSCHGPSALGDGRLVEDAWSKPVIKYQQNHPEIDIRSIGFLPPRLIRPRNLRINVYRGGRRPLDLFYRLYAGIEGSEMPETKSSLSETERWQVVDYLRRLPFESVSQPLQKRDRDKDLGGRY